MPLLAPPVDITNFPLYADALFGKLDTIVGALNFVDSVLFIIYMLYERVSSPDALWKLPRSVISPLMAVATALF